MLEMIFLKILSIEENALNATFYKGYGSLRSMGTTMQH